MILVTPVVSAQNSLSRRHHVLWPSPLSRSLFEAKACLPSNCCLVRSSSRNTCTRRRSLLRPKSACFAGSESICRCQRLYVVLCVAMERSAEVVMRAEWAPLDGRTALQWSRSCWCPQSAGACITKLRRLDSRQSLCSCCCMLPSWALRAPPVSSSLAEMICNVCTWMFCRSPSICRMRC